MPFNKRRTFLKKLGVGLTATIAAPAFGISNAKPYPFNRTTYQLANYQDPLDEKYWEMVKQQFAISGDKMMVNSANLCPSPYFIHEEVNQYSSNLAKDVSFQNRAKFGEQRQKALDSLVSYLGISKEEIGITRNTSESNNIVVNGLDFAQGDEIIIWDQNHPSNGIAWEQRAKRHGLILKKISVPVHPKSQEELIKPFEEAITPKTRIIAFSHISNVSGLALPAKEICQMATQRSVLTLIDGAQSFGFMDLNLTELDCDFFTASTHKWLMGPMENGILFIKKAQMAKLWPNTIGAGWKEDSQTVDEKVCVLGQRNTPTTAALDSIVQFHLMIGKENVERRVRDLNAYLKEQLREKIPSIEFITPLSRSQSGGIVILQIPGKDARSIFQQLYTEYSIACAPTGGIRLSPNIHNTLKDMDRIVEALAKLSS